jgi:hypothetical protein
MIQGMHSAKLNSVSSDPFLIVQLKILYAERLIETWQSASNMNGNMKLERAVELTRPRNFSTAHSVSLVVFLRATEWELLYWATCVGKYIYITSDWKLT